jgi:ABC-2 type transport system permease protein
MQRVNWYGMYILSMREIKRFVSVYNQTIIAPAISALIFLAVFVLALGSGDKLIGEVKFINFMGYGLIIMSIVQNAFANSSSSLIMSKVLGYITDILVAPLTGFEIISALCTGAIVRGIIVGIVVTICLLPFIDFTIHHPLLLIYFTVFSCILLGLLGVFTGIIANSFDHSAAITTYLITPLSFLSGTFYSTSKLPPVFATINCFNPFFYMIDGFRYSLTNHADSNIVHGIVILFTVNAVLFFTSIKMIDKGWRIKG